MRHTILPALLLFCLMGTECIAQTKPREKKHHMVLYGGLGPNFYFNNLVLAKDQVNEFNYTTSVRLMWEPEHRLSLGVETGYNRLYTIKTTSGTNNEIRIVNSAIPLHAVVSMKFFKQFYGCFILGPSIIQNKLSSTLAGDNYASVVSLGDFGLAAGYRKKINNKISIGTELKWFLSTKLEDKNLSALFVMGYHF
ncbi:MAG: hypothetical protein RLZZ28_1481 [Bacteroidota bacterium]|jgi:hypothetical protein